jgi:diguanylate cyclase (GGDEF)-like protein
VVRQQLWGRRGPELKGEVSGIVTGSLVHYLETQGGQSTLSLFVREAGIPDVVLKNLQDPSLWVPAEEAANLFRIAQRILRNPLIGREVGQFHIRPHEPYGIADALAEAGSDAGPPEAYEHLESVIPRYASFLTLRKMDIGATYAILSLNARPGFRLDLQLCYFIQGVLQSIPVLFNLVPAVVTESECLAKGGRFCLYSVGWQQAQWSTFVKEKSSLLATAWEGEDLREPESKLNLSTSEQIKSLENQVASLTMRLENVYKTAAELLSAAQLPQVLQNIIRAAARTVNAKRYLLIVRTREGERHTVLSEGIEPAEAARLAEAFLSGRPPMDVHVLRIDIKSRLADYGWLVALNPEGVRFLDQDRKTLQLYADYAASALDVATALDKEQRSHQTARALLDFARQLAGAQTRQEVGSHLAKAARTVLGATGAVVLLSDPSDGSFIEIARSVPPAIESTAPPPPIKVPPGLASRMLELTASGEPFVVTADMGPEVEAMLRPWGANALLVTPLVSSSGVTGALVTGFDAAANGGAGVDSDIKERSLGLASQAVTALSNAERLEQIRHMATHDALTGLANRRYFEQRLAEEIRRVDDALQPLTVFFIDLDRFKQVNDSMGHAAGDELIRQVAQRLSQSVRSQDLVARLGGDEFAVILPGLGDKEVIAKLANRILESLRRPFLIEGREVVTSGSIGAATKYPNDNLGYDDLVRQADTAMYSSKSGGRNAFSIWRESMNADVAASQQLAQEIPGALSRGEFELVYQFQIDQEHLDIVGVEALARWHHPRLGTLLPSQFLPAARERGLISALDSYVLEKAVSQLKTWDDEGVRIPRMCVNVAVDDLINGSLIETLRSVLGKYGVDPQRLEVEIPQKDAQKLSLQLAGPVAAIRHMGVRVAVDNVGIDDLEGAILSAYRFSTFKLDNVVVEGIAKGDPKDFRLVAEAIGLAKETGARVVAQGVERADQARSAEHAGLRLAQGFFYSPPYPPARISQLLKSPQAVREALARLGGNDDAAGQGPAGGHGEDVGSR